MWPLAIEFTDEFVEACLLLKKRPSGWSGCFLLQCQMHALMPAVLLRMAGLDAFELIPSLSQKTESLERL